MTGHFQGAVCWLAALTRVWLLGNPCFTPRQRSRSGLISFWRETLPPSGRRPCGLLEVPSTYPLGTAVGTRLPEGATQKTVCTHSACVFRCPREASIPREQGSFVHTSFPNTAQTARRGTLYPRPLGDIFPTEADEPDGFHARVRESSVAGKLR